MSDLSRTLTEAAGKHLWDVDHPYYWEQGNYYKNGCHSQASTWGDFYDEVKDWDPDMNLLVRWDWHKPENGVNGVIGTLATYWVGQRKASLWSMECPVHPDEEPAVREWLRPRFAKLAALWLPLPLPTPEDIEEQAGD